MFEFSPAEIVGYVASALVVLSLTMTSVVRLRSISLVGSIAFVTYGALIGSVPLIVTNVAIACINIWFLRTELGMRRDLGAIVVPIDSPFLADFISFHLDDIHRFQPGFEPPPRDSFALLLTRDGLPAGAVMGTQHDHVLHIGVDYVMKAYRDSHLGQWLYGPGAAVFRAHGITKVTSSPGNDIHRAYLERIGFTPQGDVYGLDLPT